MRVTVQNPFGADFVEACLYSTVLSIRLLLIFEKACCENMGHELNDTKQKCFVAKQQRVVIVACCKLPTAVNHVKGGLKNTIKPRIKPDNSLKINM